LFLLLQLGSGFNAGAFFVSGTIRNRRRFGGKEECSMPKAAPHPDAEISHKKYGETTIGQLRRTYGADFAEGCADNETIADVLRKRPSLKKVIRDREARRFVAL
jgi:hypothetical protein